LREHWIIRLRLLYCKKNPVKKLFILWLFLPLIACNQTLTQTTGAWKKMNINGPVKEMSSRIYKVTEKDGETVADESSQLLYENHSFDSVGNFLDSYIERLSFPIVTTYRKNSNDVLYTLHTVAGYPAIDTVIYTNGVMDSIISKNKSGNIYNTIKLKLDKEGNVIEKIKRNTFGEIVEITKAEYKNGWLTNEIITDGAGRIVRKSEREIDGSGKIRSIRISDAEKEIHQASFKYSGYDEFYNWTQRTEFDKSGNATTITIRYFMYYGKKYK
jgi:hypothetical protein